MRKRIDEVKKKIEEIQITRLDHPVLAARIWNYKPGHPENLNASVRKRS